MMKDYFSRLSLPECAVKVNGQYLERTIVGYRTSSVSGRNELSSDLFEKTIGDTGPTKYLYKKDKTRDILVQFALVADTRFEHEKLFNELKGVLHVDNSKFVFDDEPDVYYIGTVRDVTCRRVDSSGSDAIASVGEIAIHCSDPYKYSNTITTVTAQVEDGKLVAHVDNDSSGDIFPVYRIKHKAENGYIGIVHTGGAFEMGNIEEADTTPYEQSETLFNSDINGFDAFKPYIGVYPQNPSFNCNGTLNVGNVHKVDPTTKNYEALYLDARGTSSGGIFGGCRRLELPADSEGEVGAKNFYLWFQPQFMTGAMGQTGVIQVMLTDENNGFIACFEVSKTDATGNTARVVFINGTVSDNNAGWYKKFDLLPTVYQEHNPFVHVGYEDILKEGSTIRFFFWGSYYTVDIPAIKEKKVRYVYVFIGQYAGRSNYVTVMNVGKILVVKNRVEKQRDVPNRYSPGSEVVIDCENDSITVRGLPRNDEMVTGSAFYPLPPGETDIEFYTSSWCKERPEVTIEYKKRWL
ncbi:MAG: hypothetical protein EUB_01604 [Eubacterium sp.]|uniref:distal tail protein Dit n=1 Tax=Eubacterium sp. TaxID=142586 RepID=UPI003058372D